MPHSQHHILGDTHIYETVLGYKFRISPQAFFQLNTPAAQVLYTVVQDYVRQCRPSAVLDVGCGTGKNDSLNFFCFVFDFVCLFVCLFVCVFSIIGVIVVVFIIIVLVIVVIVTIVICILVIVVIMIIMVIVVCHRLCRHHHQGWK
jgi:hypothetical protein